MCKSSITLRFTMHVVCYKEYFTYIVTLRCPSVSKNYISPVLYLPYTTSRLHIYEPIMNFISFFFCYVKNIYLLCGICDRRVVIMCQVLIHIYNNNYNLNASPLNKSHYALRFPVKQSCLVFVFIHII